MVEPYPSEEVCGATFSWLPLRGKPGEVSVARADLPRAGGRGLTSTTTGLLSETTVRGVAAGQKVWYSGCCFSALPFNFLPAAQWNIWAPRRAPTSFYTFLLIAHLATGGSHTSLVGGWSWYINSSGAVTLRCSSSYLSSYNEV